MDTIVKTRFYIWLEENHILDHMQTAYRQDENITQAMLSFVLRAFKGFSKGETTIAVSIDLEGAFDAVWRMQSHSNFMNRVWEVGCYYTLTPT